MQCEQEKKDKLEEEHIMEERRIAEEVTAHRFQVEMEERKEKLKLEQEEQNVMWTACYGPRSFTVVGLYI